MDRGRDLGQFGIELGGDRPGMKRSRAGWARAARAGHHGHEPEPDQGHVGSGMAVTGGGATPVGNTTTPVVAAIDEVPTMMMSSC